MENTSNDSAALKNIKEKYLKLYKSFMKNPTDQNEEQIEKLLMDHYNITDYDKFDATGGILYWESKFTKELGIDPKDSVLTKTNREISQINEIYKERYKQFHQIEWEDPSYPGWIDGGFEIMDYGVTALDTAEWMRKNPLYVSTKELENELIGYDLVSPEEYNKLEKLFEILVSPAGIKELKDHKPSNTR